MEDSVREIPVRLGNRTYRCWGKGEVRNLASGVAKQFEIKNKLLMADRRFGTHKTGMSLKRNQDRFDAESLLNVLLQRY